MNRNKSLKFVFKSFLTLLAAVAFVSCQSFLGSQKGQVVPQPNRVELDPDGTHSGVWDAPYLIFQYTYRKERQKIILSGDVLLKMDLIQGFEKVYLMILTAYFLDQSGHILTNKVVLNWNRPEKIEKWSVSKIFDLPKNTTAMAFGYTGELRDGLKDSAILDLYDAPTSAI